MAWIHIQSEMTSTFGRVDETGHVVELRQASAGVARLDQDSASEAQSQCREAWEALNRASPADKEEGDARCHPRD